MRRILFSFVGFESREVGQESGTVDGVGDGNARGRVFLAEEMTAT